MQFEVEEISCDEIFEKQEISQRIREQIGIATLIACGAKEWLFLDKKRGVQFKTNNKYIEIVLNSFDTYDITYFQIKRATHEKIIIKQCKDIYSEQLSEVIYNLVNKGA